MLIKSFNVWLSSEGIKGLTNKWSALKDRDWTLTSASHPNVLSLPYNRTSFTAIPHVIHFIEVNSVCTL